MKNLQSLKCPIKPTKKIPTSKKHPPLYYPKKNLSLGPHLTNYYKTIQLYQEEERSFQTTLLVFGLFAIPTYAYLLYIYIHLFGPSYIHLYTCSGLFIPYIHTSIYLDLPTGLYQLIYLLAIYLLAIYLLGPMPQTPAPILHTKISLMARSLLMQFFMLFLYFYLFVLLFLRRNN